MNKKHLNGVYRLESGKATVAVYVRLGVVQEASDPTLRRFIGQPLKNLVRWMENHECVERAKNDVRLP